MTHQEVALRMDLAARIKQANERLEFFASQEYLTRSQGTLGADPALVKESLAPPQHKVASV